VLFDTDAANARGVRVPTDDLSCKCDKRAVQEADRVRCLYAGLFGTNFSVRMWKKGGYKAVF